MAKWEPNEADFSAMLIDQNPWQGGQGGAVPQELAPPTRRPLAKQLHRIVRRSPLRRFHMIVGSRRVGKTTVMYQTVAQLLEQGIAPQDLNWLRLDHPLLRDVELGGMVRQLCQTHAATEARPLYLFLDELTYAANWDLWLKTFYDERWPVRVVGTSSATAAILQRGRESGVGRWDEILLSPYLFDEYLDLQGVCPPFEIVDHLSASLQRAAQQRPQIPDADAHRRAFLVIGGFPELLTQLDLRLKDDSSAILRSQRVLRSDAVERAIYKDIPQTFEISGSVKLERLLYCLAGQVTGLYSPNSLGPTVGLTAPTLERYLQFLEWAFLVFALPNYAPREETIQRRGRKVYFCDGAVRNAALERGLRPISDPGEMGLLFENAAASHLYALGRQAGVRLYHWRDGGNEVDFVYDDPNGPLAFEIASSTQHHTRGIEAFRRRFPAWRGQFYLVAPDAIPQAATTDQIGRLPLALFLMTVGRQAERAMLARLDVPAEE